MVIPVSLYLDQMTILLNDEGYHSWRRLGNLVTAVFAVGFRRDEMLRHGVPPFLVQMRRCLFAGSYYLDKSVATFLGRPPLIASRYCEYQLPLDLSDEDTIALRDTPMDSLDAFGWNTANEVSSATWIRVRFMIALIREEILEISMAVSTSDLRSLGV